MYCTWCTVHYLWITRSGPCVPRSKLCHITVSQKYLLNKRYLPPLIPWKTHVKEVHVALPRFAVMSLPSSTKQINVGREEFAYNPACVFAFVLEKQGKARKHCKYNGFKHEGNIIWLSSYRVHAVSNKCHFLGWPDPFTSYNKKRAHGGWLISMISAERTPMEHTVFSCWIT